MYLVMYILFFSSHYLCVFGDDHDSLYESRCWCRWARGYL